MGDRRHAPAALPPGKTRYLLYRRLGGPQGQSGQVRKISHPPGFDPRTVQPRSSVAIPTELPVSRSKLRGGIIASHIIKIVVLDVYY